MLEERNNCMFNYLKNNLCNVVIMNNVILNNVL